MSFCSIMQHHFVLNPLSLVSPHFIFRYELLFYPRYHLDQSSLLCRKPLLAKPMVMDVYQDHMLLTYRPFDVHIFHVKLFGELSPSGSPDLQVNAYFQIVLLLFLASSKTIACYALFIYLSFLL